MMLARRLGHHFELLGKTPAFIGWGLLIQGVFFALMGVMPNLWLACLLLFLGRIVLGAEFGVQDALLMRLAPDKLRGRVITTDRATEFLTWSLSTTVAAGRSEDHTADADNNFRFVIVSIRDSVAGVVLLRTCKAAAKFNSQHEQQKTSTEELVFERVARHDFSPAFEGRDPVSVLDLRRVSDDECLKRRWRDESSDSVQ